VANRGLDAVVEATTGAVHYVWADGPVEIQITALGPWEVHPYE
jgi:hypothetical protein